MIEELLTLKHLLSILDEVIVKDRRREITIMRWRGYTYEEIGKRFGRSRERMRQEYRSGMNDIRRWWYDQTFPGEWALDEREREARVFREKHRPRTRREVIAKGVRDLTHRRSL